MTQRQRQLCERIDRVRKTILWQFDFEPGETALHPQILAALADLETADHELARGRLDNAELRLQEATRRVSLGSPVIRPTSMR